MPEPYSRPIPTPPSPGFVPPPSGPPGPVPYHAPVVDPRVKELADKATLWLLVGLLGSLVGGSLVCGPLAWFGGARVRAGYAELGMAPSSTATAAWIIGMVATILTILSVLSVVAYVLLFGFY